jgi:hypothetical protein
MIHVNQKEIPINILEKYDEVDVMREVRLQAARELIESLTDDE